MQKQAGAADWRRPKVVAFFVPRVGISCGWLAAGGVQNTTVSARRSALLCAAAACT